MKKELFKGCATAIITPFKNGKVDFLALKKIITMQIKAKVSAIVVLGTTGEPSTLTQKEKKQIITLARELIPKDIKLIVGTGAYSTKQVIKNNKVAKELGADGFLIVTPYYNKCSSQGLFLHYKTIAEKTTLPIIVYNVPSRTGINITPEEMLKLSEISNIVGIKEASGNILQASKLFCLVNEKIAIYSGEDELNFCFLSLGASGVISVLSNIIPKQVQQMCKFAFANKFLKAKDIYEKYYFLAKSLFSETNPIPIKHAMSLKGLCKNELRLPLCKIGATNGEIVENELKKAKLLKDV